MWLKRRSVTARTTIAARSRLARLAGAVIRDPQVAVQQVLSFISEGAVITQTGKRISTPIRTFCTHGDEPTGVEVVRAVCESLARQGIGVARLAQLAF